MEKMHYRRDDLLQVMKTNRDSHRALFEKAMTGFEDFCERELKEQLALARKRHPVKRILQFTPPQDHTADYDRVIRMIEMAVPDEIELSEKEFAMYVLDEWVWKDQFATSVMTYAQPNYGSST